MSGIKRTHEPWQEIGQRCDWTRLGICAANIAKACCWPNCAKTSIVAVPARIPLKRWPRNSYGRRQHITAADPVSGEDRAAYAEVTIQRDGTVMVERVLTALPKPKTPEAS